MESELFYKLSAAMKEAMKAHDTIKRDCLRTIISDIKNATVNSGVEIADSICIKVLQKSAKTHNDSIVQFEAAGRNELAMKEKAELDVINSFLPKMMDTQEAEAHVKRIADELSCQLGHSLSKKEMGLVMKTISASKDASRIDMKAASKFAALLLS